MFKNYLKVAFRNVIRNGFSSVINIGGLAFGMAVAILIGLWVYEQSSFDRSIPNHDRIAAVLQNQDLSGGISTWRSQARQLAPALLKDYGRLFKQAVTVYGPSQHPMVYGDIRIKSQGAYVDPGIIDMLSLRMLQGSKEALNDPSAIILSASVAKGLFGNAEPMGKMLRVNNTELHKVTGIYADLPANSSFANFLFIIPFQYLINTDSTISGLSWGNSWFNTYVLLDPKADMAGASRAIGDVKYLYSEKERRFKPKLFLQSLNDWHLHSDFKNGVCVGGYIQYVQLFALIGVFVLLLACINFMNLSTARSERRAKEVGIRKAIGSMRGQLIRQFFSESLLIALLSFFVAIGLAQMLLPWFNSLGGREMTIPYDRPFCWLCGLCFVFCTGLLAGSYPALYLSSFRPVKVLKGTFRVGKLAALPRKALVVVQFSVSVILIIGTIAVFHQIQFVKDRPVGYSRDGLLTVPMQSNNIHTHYEALRTDLLQTGLVDEVAVSRSSIINSGTTNMGYNWKGKDPSLQEEFTVNEVTPEFGEVTGWQVVAGRNFSREMATDSNCFIINETAVKYMGLKQPVGEIVTWSGNGNYTIIGVVKDMISESPFQPIRPMIFSLDRRHGGFVNIRVKPQADMPRAIAAISTVFRKYDADNAFEYHFADQEYAKKFGSEERVGRLAGFFAGLAILISCLGLLGLSAFVAEQRTREVGIRKVLGASVVHLWHLLSGEFLLLVSISLLAGGPIAYWIMHGWLNNYAYHASLSWWIFALAAGGALSLTLLTVNFQAIRTALTNPVKSLRTE
jgi:putative ABC transport system permease protein